MNSDDHDESLIARARAAVDREVEGLDAATRARLSAARRTALAELEARRGGFAPGWAPVGVAAAVAVVAVGVTLSMRAPLPAAGVEPATEFELLLTNDDLALYDEELEFYAWLEEQGDAG